MPSKPDTQLVDNGVMRQVLGESTAELIDTIASHAQKRGFNLFLVGGVVRDIILGLPNQDLDFVLEADAIRFADELAAQFGGTVLAHKPFGTAIWTLDSCAAENLMLPAHQIPQHIDFARARSETYKHPAALPTVAPADIQSDLRRRDFTLNTLAIQLSPAQESGQLLDECGGFADLQNGLIAILHDRSFIDDPTRILRAMRISLRLGFIIEARTDKLMRAALPQLGRVTGPRLVNEIDLILREPKAGEILLQLQDLGALKSIQPAFRVSPDLPDQLTRFRETTAPWQATIDKHCVLWSLLLAAVPEGDADAICQRLSLSRTLTKSIGACARLIDAADILRDGKSPPSQAAQILDGLLEPALHAAWLLLADSPTAQNKLLDYMNKWRHQRPSISGADLEQMGIPPGPRYKRILDALRFAWIDSKINSPKQEQAYLRELIAKED